MGFNDSQGARQHHIYPVSLLVHLSGVDGLLSSIILLKDRACTLVAFHDERLRCFISIARVYDSR